MTDFPSAWLHLSLANGVLLILILVFGWMVYRFNRNPENSYNLVDTVMGPNNRASLTNHILLSMAGLAMWVVVDREMDGKDDVGSILVQVLAIFVLGKTVTIAADIIKRPSEPEPDSTTIVTDKTEKKIEKRTADSPPPKPHHHRGELG